PLFKKASSDAFFYFQRALSDNAVIVVINTLALSRYPSTSLRWSLVYSRLLNGICSPSFSSLF
ncbi:hypothetical protein ACQ3G7_10245, partial [Kosakonia oryzendophytica]|uniref:hypothetical protein n=1 Tax=Kosakonia oryzendophytica TaxID=1005665 RepID=UPI003D32EC82